MTTSITAFPITAKQIAELTSAASAAGTDFLMAQQGTTGTAYRKMTVAQVMGSGAAVVASGVTVNAATVPANGMYLRGTNTLGLAVNSAGEVQLTASALSPIASDSNALGTTSLMWSDVFLASGAVINFAAGNYTLTHSVGLLTASGPITIDTASNATSGTSTAPGLILSDSASGSGFDIVTPWAVIDWVTADASTGGPGRRVRIGATAEAVFGGASRFSVFANATAGTDVERFSVFSDGRVHVGRNAATDANLVVNGAAASNRLLQFSTAGVARVALRANNIAESGSNVGSDLGITAYSDAGVVIFSTTHTRSTGAWSFPAAVSAAGAVTIGASGNTLVLTHNATGSTAATIVGGSTGGMTFGTSGSVQLAVTHTASAVNYVSVTGAGTTNGPKLSAVGSDAVIHLRLAAKSSGSIIAENNIILEATRVLVVDTLQVVGARDTGWTAMTGTADEVTSYATSSITLAQLAGRVMALQTALTTHGLIGT